jgi:hypothetical protein
MDSDFRPPKRPAESKQTKTDSLPQTPKINQPSFKTPEQIAAADGAANLAAMLDHPTADTPKLGRFHKPKLHWPPSKTGWFVSSLSVLICGCIVAFVLNHAGAKPVANAVSVKPASKPVVVAPTTVASTLSGLPVSPSLNQNPVTGVMIENTLDARPQSGLSQAGVVFEAIAEGGITRFLALYQDQAPASLGPVRSARPYYVEWAMGFNAGYAHVGGSPDALADIKAWNTRDLDEFNNAGAYHRITSRQAPHNMYTSMAALNQLEASKGYTSNNFSGFPRKAAAPAKVPAVKTINLTMSGPTYDVQYAYNPATNSYNRSEGGAPQIDANTNSQLSPQVVIAIVVPETRGALDASNAYYSDYASIGSGQAYVYQDGNVTTGQWSKTSPTSQITFKDATGKSIALNPGQTWITAVTSPSDVVSAP